MIYILHLTSSLADTALTSVQYIAAGLPTLPSSALSCLSTLSSCSSSLLLKLLSSLSLISSSWWIVWDSGVGEEDREERDALAGRLLSFFSFRFVLSLSAALSFSAACLLLLLLWECLWECFWELGDRSLSRLFRMSPDIARAALSSSFRFLSLSAPLCRLLLLSSSSCCRTSMDESWSGEEKVEEARCDEKTGCAMG